MLTDSPFVIKNTNSIVTILIANLLTLDIIRTVDIFTLQTYVFDDAPIEQVLDMQQEQPQTSNVGLVQFSIHRLLCQTLHVPLHPTPLPHQILHINPASQLHH
jgi:hypothetical protein